MGQNNQKDQKGPKMTAAVMLLQNNQNNQKIWSLHISHTILKVRFFWDTLYMVCLFVLEFSSWSPLRQWPIFCSNVPSKGNEVECHRVPLTIFRSPDRFQRKSMLSSWPGRDNAVLLLSSVALAGGFNRIFWAPGTCLG